MPLQLWVQAARAGLRIKEVGVPRLYLDPNRAFGGVLNDADGAAGVLPQRDRRRGGRSAVSRAAGCPCPSAPCSFVLMPKRTCR